MAIFDSAKMTKRSSFEDPPPEIRELGAFSTEFNKESDRGAVLVAASRFDEVLKKLLRAYLRDSKSAEELLEGYNAPLATFSARASSAHALSLIEDHEFREITLIRKIRNEFGHKWRDIGFDSEKISSLCAQLPWLGPDDLEEEKKDPRARFNFAVVILLTDLLWRERYVLKEKKCARSWPSKIRGPKDA